MNSIQKTLALMNILLTNNHFNSFGGTENYTAEMAQSLTRLGHHVSIYIVLPFEKSLPFEFFRTRLQHVQWYSEHPPLGPFDLILINHNTSLKRVRGLTGCKIFTSHGLPDLERPIPGADHYVFISKELFDLHSDITNRSIIKTGFSNTSEQTPPYREHPKAVFVDYSPSPEIRDLFMNSCREFDIEPSCYFDKNTSPEDLRRRLSASDIVCATGRTALESVILERRVIILGHFGCDGIVNTVLDDCNYSGRHYRDFSRLKESLRVAKTLDKSYILNLKNEILTTRNIDLVMRQYLDLYLRLTGSSR